MRGFKDIGFRLRTVRDVLKYNQSEFAKILDISRPFLSLCETGSNKPSFEILLHLNQLGINLNWLLTGEGEMMDHSSKFQRIDDPELAELVELSNNIKQVRRAVLSELDRIKVVFKEIIDTYRTEQKEKEKEKIG